MMENLLDAFVSELENRIEKEPGIHVDTHVTRLYDDLWAKLIETGQEARLEQFRREAV
jgi:endonuclease III